jgi:4-amino-4-deoxy-L-arabinose transferase-like glycosyltransferase
VTAVAGAAREFGGETLGLIAAGIFVVFAIWIVVQRLRSGRGDRRD